VRSILLLVQRDAEGTWWQAARESDDTDWGLVSSLSHTRGFRLICYRGGGHREGQGWRRLRSPSHWRCCFLRPPCPRSTSRAWRRKTTHGCVFRKPRAIPMPLHGLPHRGTRRPCDALRFYAHLHAHPPEANAQLRQPASLGFFPRCACRRARRPESGQRPRTLRVWRPRRCSDRPAGAYRRHRTPRGLPVTRSRS
jgi:hypothetical protein